MAKHKPEPPKKPRGKQQRSCPGGAGTSMHKKSPKRNQKLNTKAGGAALQDVPLVVQADDSDASDLALSDEDLEFVEEHRRSLGFLEKLDKAQLDKSIRREQERQAREAAEARRRAAQGGSGDEQDDEEDDEQDGEGEEDEEAEAYEKAPRPVQDDLREKAAAGLPTKTLTGDVMYDKAEQQEGSAAGRRRGAKQAAAWLREAEMEAALAAAAAIQVEGVTITDDMQMALAEGRRKAAEEAARREREEQKKAAAAAAKKAEEAQLPPALRGLNLSALDPAARRAKLQEAMAAAAQKLLAAPELSIGELRTLQALVADADTMTSRLALLSLFAVFKDILPGYRVRPPTEKELQVAVSKDVAKLREYEQALLKAYQTYLRSLLDAAQCVERGRGTLSHSRVAVRCLCGLLVSHPHFNYTSDILQAVVPRMASQDEETRSMACEAVRSLLQGGDQGDEAGAGKAALEAVQLVADLVRTRKCVTPPQVVRTLSCLRFREVSRPRDEGDEEAGGKRRHKGGKKAEKRDAKRRRKEDDVARALKEAAAGPDKEDLARLQSSILEALFEIYFRVLKHCCAVGLAAPGGGGGPDGPGLRVPSASHSPPWSRARLLQRCPLLLPVLDGLARYTHLISVDYLNDLLAVFHQLLAGPGLPLPERLRLLATIAALLRGQGEALNVDRRDLYVQLYDTLLQVPLHSLLSDEPAAAGSPGTTALKKGTAISAAAGNNNNNDDGDEDGEEDDADVAMAAACERLTVAASGNDACASVAPAAAQPSSPSPSTSPSVGSSVAALLAGVLEALLCEPKMADMQRGAAFVKRMAGAALLAGPGEAMALWAAIARLLRRYPKLANLLEYEGETPTVGGRTYDPFCTDPSEAGGLATTLWEVCLASGESLHPHYHPHLAQAARSIMALRPGAAAAAATANGGGGSAVHLTGPLGMPATMTELAEAYDASRGLLRPPPPPPPPPPPSAGGGGKKGKVKGRRGGAGGSTAAAAAAALSVEFLEEIARLANEYGGTTGNGGWNGMELKTDDGSEDDDEVYGNGHTAEDDDDEGVDDGERGARARLSGLNASTSGGDGGGRDAVAASALRRMFLESRRFHRNKALRQEKMLMVERLKRFHIHLHQKQVEAAAAAATAAAAAAAPAHVKAGAASMSHKRGGGVAAAKQRLEGFTPSAAGAPVPGAEDDKGRKQAVKRIRAVSDRAESARKR